MDNRRAHLEKDFADAGLALLMDWSAESDGELLWEEFCSDKPRMSHDLDIRCRKLIQKARRNTHFHRIGKSVGKMAASFVLVFFLAVSLITSVEALRVPVLNFFLKHSPRATSIVFQQNSTTKKQNQLEELLSILKSFVPEGYTLELEKVYRDEYVNPPIVTSVFLIFKDADEHLIYIETSPAEGVRNIDTEDATVSQIILAGLEAMLIEKSPEIRVIWLNKTQNLLYSVTASSMEKSDFMEYVTTLAWETRYSNAGLNG